jgi:hypothetical protein
MQSSFLVINFVYLDREAHRNPLLAIAANVMGNVVKDQNDLQFLSGFNNRKLTIIRL